LLNIYSEVFKSNPNLNSFEEEYIIEKEINKIYQPIRKLTKNEVCHEFAKLKSKKSPDYLWFNNRSNTEGASNRERYFSYICLMLSFEHAPSHHNKKLQIKISKTKQTLWKIPSHIDLLIFYPSLPNYLKNYFSLGWWRKLKNSR